MNPFEPYNEVVRACFENPIHAGDLEGHYAEVRSADVAESAQGVWVRLAVGITDGIVAQMRFRAWGCPHVISAAELLCRDKENGPVAGLSRFDLNALMAQLSVPEGKTGKILLLEDAIKRLWAQHQGAA